MGALATGVVEIGTDEMGADPTALDSTGVATSCVFVASAIDFSETLLIFGFTFSSTMLGAFLNDDDFTESELLSFFFYFLKGRYILNEGL